MNIESIKEIGQIKKHFGFLFDEGYSIIYVEPARHFNNWLVDLKSDKYRIQFCEDRGELMIRMGIKNASTGWNGIPLHEITTLIFYLSNEKTLIGWHSTDHGFEEAAMIFKSYQLQFEDILLETNYPRYEPKIKKAAKLLTKAILDSINRG